MLIASSEASDGRGVEVNDGRGGEKSGQRRRYIPPCARVPHSWRMTRRATTGAMGTAQRAALPKAEGTTPRWKRKERPQLVEEGTAHC